MPTHHPTRLRQIALVTHNLPRARHLLTHIFCSPIIFEDPAVAQWGLTNFLLPLGGDIIEVVSPSTPGPGTTAGRLLEKRGEGGYMIIMQTGDAGARRKEIEAKGRKVIFSHSFEHGYRSWGQGRDRGWCVQYHPKGIKGGVIPELDSHEVCEWNERPLHERFSPWHAAGPDYEAYVKGMRETEGLHLMRVRLRLAAGDGDVGGAVEQWSGLFGVESKGDELAFTNCKMGFVEGHPSRPEGLVEVVVGVESKEEIRKILERASKLCLNGDGWFEAVGVRWSLVLMDDLRARL